MAFSKSPWQHPPPRPALADGEVHLWRFSLVSKEPLECLLEEQELQRASRLRVPRKARAFITARARLRQILSCYLELPPEGLRFDYGPAAKPALAGGLADAPAFNLAHSGGWGLCAVARGVVLGVDIERIDARLDFEKLAAAFFSRDEHQRLLACVPHRRRRSFFRLWTRKEAWLKGRGSGFTDSRQSLAPEHLGGICTFDGSWWLMNLPVARHYLAALAVSEKPASLQRWHGCPPGNR